MRGGGPCSLRVQMREGWVERMMNTEKRWTDEGEDNGLWISLAQPLHHWQ